MEQIPALKESADASVDVGVAIRGSCAATGDPTTTDALVDVKLTTGSMLPHAALTLLLNLGLYFSVLRYLLFYQVKSYSINRNQAVRCGTQIPAHARWALAVVGTAAKRSAAHAAPLIHFIVYSPV